MALAKGTFFFEAMPLGTDASISALDSVSRQTRGFTQASQAIRSFPIVGSYGWSRTVTVSGAHTATDGDFQTWLLEMDTILAYLQTATKNIEDRFALRHDVSNRALGTLGYVVDPDRAMNVTSINVNAGGSPGRVELNFDDTDPDLGLVLGDRIVVTLIDGLPDIGEIAKVAQIFNPQTTNATITFDSRLLSTDGTVPYEGRESELKILVAESWWDNAVFRDFSYAAPRTLGDGGSVQSGIRFIFACEGRFRRRGGIIPVVAESPGSPWGGSVYGAGNRAAEPVPDEFPNLFSGDPGGPIVYIP
jgi:hypothetical protein